jgi:RHS repeat-associated protein
MYSVEGNRMASRERDVASGPVGESAPRSAEPPAGRQVHRPAQADESSDDRRPQHSSDLLPHVTLPKGGGAIRGIGEKFAVNPATGSGSLSVPLPLAPGRSGFAPQLSLSYDSGAGNGPFGFGWDVALPSVTRKTDKGLPRYCDGDESDVFILSGAEDLVPILDAQGQPVAARQRSVHGTAYKIWSYRPRIEGLFARIERWVDVATGLSHWRSISRDNVTTLYGLDALAPPYAPGRVADPADPRKIFSYLIGRTWDDKGNVAIYEYLAEDRQGIDSLAAHEANRTNAGRAARRYLKSIRYGNVQPYFPAWGPDGPETPLPADWLFQVVFDYGDHSAAVPTPEPDRSWAMRPDPFSTYRAGFEVRTYRRVARVLLFHNVPDDPSIHNVPGEPSIVTGGLVRSVDLVYSDQQAPSDLRKSIYTFIGSITQTGYRREGAGAVARSLPPLDLTYSQPEIFPDVLPLDPDARANLPEGIDGSRFQWVDLDGEGLPGILTDAGGAWGYKRNLGPTNRVPLPDGTLVARARFGPLESVATLPSRSELGGSRQLLDLSGGGVLDVVDFGGPAPGFFKRTPAAGWEPFQTFDSLPEIDWAEPNLKFVDLTGDGRADVLLTEDGLYTLYASLGEAGFDRAEQVRPPWDEERGPAVVLADGSETIFLADMSGDGLSDLVRVRNGEVCYWPNLGYGRFGSKVTMDGAPRFADLERFDPRRIRLADVDGSGTTDVLYLGDDGVHVCFNQSGNAWAAPARLAVFPSADALGSVRVIDLLGTGTACLVWSSPLPADAGSPLLYVDLMGGRKPHLLVNVRNNLGAETRLSYAPSTRFYLEDRAAGRPWATRLPFPVHVVERVEVIDWIGRNRAVTRYAYHHGYFDGYEREFRGFGMVEQWDTDEYRVDTTFAEGDALNWDAASWSPPMRTRTWFHTGAFEPAAYVSRRYAEEYWIEPDLRPADRAADRAAMTLPDTILPSDLDPFEVREALRSLKGMVLRTEVYADDGAPGAGNPYVVTERNYTIRRIQPMGGNRHAVFFTFPRESLTFQYERNPAEPRVTHDLTLEVDPYGNPRRTVSVGYPRRAGYAPPEPHLSAALQGMLAYDQGRLHVAATERQYTAYDPNTDPPNEDLTDPVKNPDTYRTPLPWASLTAEITGITPTSNRPGITNLFGFDEMDKQLWPVLWDGHHDVLYESIPASDVDGSGAPAAAPTRRIVDQTRTVYRSDDLTTLLPPEKLQSLALPGQSYRAALTPGLLAAVFGPLVPDATLTEGGYVPLSGETGWWMPSGRLYYSAVDADTPAQELSTARAHFFLPRRAVDPFGGVARVDYDAHDLLATAATDPVGNVTTAVNDYRVLQPVQVTDANGNRTAVAFDALGLVVATAVMGKATESLGDLLSGFIVDLDDTTILAHLGDPLTNPEAILGNATTRIIYDLAAYRRTQGLPQPSPPAVYTIARETHFWDLSQNPNQATRYQHGFAYSDGFGRVIQQKAQAEPGPVVDGGPDVSPRWIGSGWTIFNNKGQPVRKYEPFFTTTPAFEFAAQSGVSSVLFHDPPGRVVATLHPDNTWEKTVFDAWRQETWDGNDTLKIVDPKTNSLVTDPRKDADVGEHFRRLLGTADPFVSWYDLRVGGTYGATPDARAAQQDAATKAVEHAGTPAVAHFDALGRTCLTVADNGPGQRYASRTALDAEGKPLAVFDALGRRVFEYVLRAPQPGGGFQYVAGTDLAGNSLYQNGMDGGARRTLADLAGQPIRSWDARGHAFRTRYDPARRPTQRYVSTNGAPEILLDRSVYGEGLPALNLCGRLYRHYDTAGVALTDQCDYKGNVLSSARQLASEYHQSIDWSPLADLTDGAALDAAAAPLLIAADRFTSTTTYDALNRPIQVVTPHSAGMNPNVLRPSYNEAGLLDRLDVWLQQSAAPAGLLDPATAGLLAVTGIRYNARRQRARLALGNGTITTYAYDFQTFRLVNLATTRPNTFPAGQQLVQDLSYFYDPVGNITRIRDDADIQNVIYFQNQRVEPSTDYTYDPIYRLITAKGREHLGQTGGALNPPQQVTNDDSPRMGTFDPDDVNAMGPYTEAYTYDGVGNLLRMVHLVSSGTWTRGYAYDETSRITPSETNNRLSATSLPGDDVENGPYSAKYTHDDHGNMEVMPHLPAMAWDEQDRMRSTTRQVVNAGTPETTFYTYDGGGQRVRKVTDRQAPAGQTPTRKTERIYLGGVEIYREFAGDGITVTLQRETLHLIDGSNRIALVENRTVGTDPAPATLIRYQYANHLGSAVLELDDQAQVVSYGEYFPYGSTSYQAVRSQTDTPKRYRYTGKERDEENDLYYHGARYYAPWVGRWISCDPLGLKDGLALFTYCRDNPISSHDPNGKESVKPKYVAVPGNFTGSETVEQLHDAAAAHGLAFSGKPQWTGKAWRVPQFTVIPGHEAQVARERALGGARELAAALAAALNPTGGQGVGSQPGTGTSTQATSSPVSEAPGGTGDRTQAPGSALLTEMDYATLLASLLAPVHAGEQSKEGVSGGLPSGKGPKSSANRVVQAAYIAVNLVFTFAEQAVKRGLKRAVGAIKAGLAKVWPGRVIGAIESGLSKLWPFRGGASVKGPGVGGPPGGPSRPQVVFETKVKGTYKVGSPPPVVEVIEPPPIEGASGPSSGPSTTGGPEYVPFSEIHPGYREGVLKGFADAQGLNEPGYPASTPKPSTPYDPNVEP